MPVTQTTSEGRASDSARSSALFRRRLVADVRAPERALEQRHHVARVAGALLERRPGDGHAVSDPAQRAHHGRLVLVDEDADDKMEPRPAPPLPTQLVRLQRLRQPSRLDGIVRRVQQHARRFGHQFETAADLHALEPLPQRFRR